MDSGDTDVLLNTNATPNCTPPPANKLSLHICAPTNGQTVGSSFTFKGMGSAFNRIAKTHGTLDRRQESCPKSGGLTGGQGVA
jgi:hypothetical protein